MQHTDFLNVTFLSPHTCKASTKTLGGQYKKDKIIAPQTRNLMRETVLKQTEARFYYC